MLICSVCLGETLVIHGAVAIPCPNCEGRGYKIVGEELEKAKLEYEESAC